MPSINFQLRGADGKPIKTTKKDSTSSSKKKTPKFQIRLAEAPKPKKKTLGQKVLGVGKDIGKAVVSPVATMVARPLQLGYELVKKGDNTEEMDKFSREKLGGLVAPIPKTGKDLIAEGGRAIQTVALGIPATKATTLFRKTIKPLSSVIAPSILGSQKVTPQVLKTTKRLSQSAGLGAEVAIFGAGADMEQGTTGTNTLMGAGIGALIPFAGAGISKVLGKSKTPIIAKGLVQKEVDNIVKGTTTKVDDVSVNIPKVIGDTYDLKTTLLRLENEGYSKNQITKIMEDVVNEQPNVNKYSDEIVSKYKSNITPELEPKVVKPKSYQENPIKKSGGEGVFKAPVPVEIEGGIGKLHGRKGAEWGGYLHKLNKAVKLFKGKGSYHDIGLEINGVEKLTPAKVKKVYKKYGGIIVNEHLTPKSTDGEATLSLKLKNELSDEVMDKIALELEQDAIPQWSNLGTKTPKKFKLIKSIPKKEYDEYRKTADDTFNDFAEKDPEYLKQTGITRANSIVDYIAVNGIDDVFDIARGAKYVSPESGFTAPFAKEFLIKSGKLTDDQMYRLLNSEATSSMSGSSLQSVTPLQKYMSDANTQIKEAFKKKVVKNKKTIRSLFEDLEC